MLGEVPQTAVIGILIGVLVRLRRRQNDVVGLFESTSLDGSIKKRARIAGVNDQRDVFCRHLRQQFLEIAFV